LDTLQQDYMLRTQLQPESSQLSNGQ